MFSVCGIFKVPDNDKDTTLFVFENKDQKDSHSNGGSSPPALKVPGCLPS